MSFEKVKATRLSGSYTSLGTSSETNSGQQRDVFAVEFGHVWPLHYGFLFSNKRKGPF